MKDNLPQKETDAAKDDNESLMFRNRLLMLHQIGNDLSTSDSFDELCRQAVIRGRQILNCQRIGLWFRNGDSMLVAGSFGIDENGNVRDERAQLLTANRHSPMGQVLGNKHPMLVNKNCDLLNDKGEAVGKGEHIIAALWNGKQIIGCICIDNLLDQKQFNEADCDILGMYASIIGHLAFGKRTEDALKKSLREKEILSQEINHRVKNNLQVISSLLNLQAAYIQDAHNAELFRQTQTRIKSMAKVYDVFQQSEDLTRINIHDYIMGIIQDLFQFYQIDTEAVILRWEGHNESFSLAQAIPCSLIVNELVTNALKHGLKHKKSDDGQPKGELSIAIRRTDQSLSITIGNDGEIFPPDVDIYHPLSLGLQLVNVLVAQLNGTLTLDKTRGARFTVTFPDNANGLIPITNAIHAPAPAGLARQK